MSAGGGKRPQAVVMSISAHYDTESTAPWAVLKIQWQYLHVQSSFNRVIPLSIHFIEMKHLSRQEPSPSRSHSPTFEERTFFKSLKKLLPDLYKCTLAYRASGKANVFYVQKFNKNYSDAIVVMINDWCWMEWILKQGFWMFSIYEYIIDIREGCGEQMLSNFESHAFQKYSKCWFFY